MVCSSSASSPESEPRSSRGVSVMSISSRELSMEVDEVEKKRFGATGILFVMVANGTPCVTEDMMNLWLVWRRRRKRREE